MKISNELCEQARALVASRLGLDFPEHRWPELERGFMCALRTSTEQTLEKYLACLAAMPEGSPEWRRLAGLLTVGETYFFRDRACFEALEQQVLIPLIAARRAEGNLRLRVWSAACATGEEPYSLAILLDRLLPDRANWALTVLATDINPEALELAHRALYREWSFRDTPQWIRDRYFLQCAPEAFELAPAIREMVTFAPLNLAEGGYPTLVTNTGAMDMILCRNVLMYFTPEAQRATVERVHRALLRGGWLAVSPAEASAELLRPLTPVNLPGAILYRKEAPKIAPQAPVILTAQPPAPAPWNSVVEVPVLPIPPLMPICATYSQPDPETLLQRARELADQGRLDDARHLCQAALQQERLSAEGHRLLAAIYQEQGEIAKALEALRRALYLEPNSAEAHFLHGSLLLRQGKRRAGLRSMETVVSLLRGMPSEAPLGGDGVTAARLMEMAHMYVEAKG